MSKGCTKSSLGWTQNTLIGFGLIALILGSWVERPQPSEELRRGSYRVLRADFHVHTRFSDGFLSPPEVVLTAERRGLDVIAVTEHNMVVPGQLARSFSAWIGGPRVLVGEEVTSASFHLIGVGLTEAIEAQPDAAQVAIAIRQQGGVSIAAHPTRSSWPAFNHALPYLDAAEVVHPVARRPETADSGGFRWSEMVSFYENSNSVKPLTAIGSSDYHFFRLMGINHTLLFSETDSEQHVMDALRAGRTVAVAPDGRRFGDPELMALLDANPLPPSPTERGYEVDSLSEVDQVLARVARTTGFLSVVGLFVFRRPQRRRSGRTQALASAPS